MENDISRLYWIYIGKSNQVSRIHEKYLQRGFREAITREREFYTLMLSKLRLEAWNVYVGAHTHTRMHTIQLLNVKLRVRIRKYLDNLHIYIMAQYSIFILPTSFALFMYCLLRSIPDMILTLRSNDYTYMYFR